MKLSLHFFLLNDHFSPEYAEAQHGGNESADNLRYEWEDELEINDLKDIKVERNAIITLAGNLPDGAAFSHDVPGMLALRLTTIDGQEASLGVSESILADYEWHEDAKHPVINIFIRDYEPHGNPIPGIYIASKEFPKALVF